VEYVLAEAMTALMRFSKLDLPSLSPPEPVGETDAFAATGTGAADNDNLRPASRPDLDPALETEFVWPEAMDQLEQIDAQLASLSQALSRRDLDIGVLGRECCSAGVHLEAGFDNFDDYCREILQISPILMASRVALANRLWRLEPIDAALIEGRIGYEAASLLARVSQKDDADTWVERATRLTVKQLREEVETARLFGRVSDEAPRPPSPSQMREAEDFERAVYSTLIGRMEPEPDMGQSQISGEKVEMVPLRLSPSEPARRPGGLLARARGGTSRACGRRVRAFPRQHSAWTLAGRVLRTLENRVFRCLSARPRRRPGGAGLPATAGGVRTRGVRAAM